MHFPRIPTATHRSSLMTYNSEQNYKNASTHFSSPHTSTSAWNNYRDQEVEFDWQTHVSGQMKHTFFTSYRQQKQFFLQLEIRMRIVCVLKKVSHDSSSKRIKILKEIRRQMFLDKLHSPLQFYNKNTSSTIVYDQGANRLRKFILVQLGASLFLIELLFN